MMYFLKQIAKALAVLLSFDLVMLALGIAPASAKFGVISTLAFFAGEFYFLNGYMDVIGLQDSFGTPGLDLSNPPPPLVWKFLGSVCFVIAVICLIAWKGSST